MIYLVRWNRHPTEPFLISAESVAHLIDHIDEVGDPGAAAFRQYNGPLAFSVNLTTPKTEDDSGMEVVGWEGEVTSEMQECIEGLLAEPEGWTAVTDVPLDQWPYPLNQIAGIPGAPEQLGVTLPKE